MPPRSTVDVETGTPGALGCSEGSGDADPLPCGSTLRLAPYGSKAAWKKVADGDDPTKGRKRDHLYRCVASAHLTVTADRTDEFLRAVVAERLNDRRIIASMQPNVDPGLAADREERRKLKRRLGRFEQDYANGDVTAAQLRKATDAVTTQLRELDERTAKVMRRSASASIMNASDPGAAFLAADLDVQRVVLASVIRVEVLPQPRRGVQWSSDRLSITPAVDAQ